MKLHAALARALRDHGVDTMFGLIGDANMFLAHSFAHEFGGRYLGAAHESGATFMGFGYADLSGRLGVVTVTHGPALTNTLTGLIEGVRGRTPMLLIAGDTATTSRTNIQDIAQRDVVMPTGAGFEQARTPQTALDDLAIAVRRAFVERRPIVLNVPSDFMWADVNYSDIPVFSSGRPVAYPDPAVVQAVAERIAAAERPVVLAGRGAIEARGALLRLASRIGAPVATTLKAKDLFRGEPFDLGIVGGLAGPATQEILDDADLVLAFGASLDAHTTRNGALLTGDRVVAIDDDPLTTPTVLGEARAVAAAITDCVRDEQARYRTAEIARRLAGQRALGERPATAPGTVDVKTALRRLDDLLPEHRLVISDGGRYGAEHVQFVDRGLDPSLSLFRWPDLAGVAEAQGGEGFTVRSLDDLDQAGKVIAERRAPLLIDLRLDVFHMTPMQ